MSKLDGSQIWRLLAPEGFAWREWDDELVIYNEATGSTHHLGALGAEVLLALMRSPDGTNVVALTRDIAARVDLGTGVQLPVEIERALEQLAHFRLATAGPSAKQTAA